MARRGNESEDEGIVEPAAIELLQQNYLETRNFVVDSSSDSDQEQSPPPPQHRHHHHRHDHRRHHREQSLPPQPKQEDEDEDEVKPNLQNLPQPSSSSSSSSTSSSEDNTPSNFKRFKPASSASAMEWLESQAKETFNTNRNAAAVIVDPNFFADIEAEYTALFTFMGYVTQLRAIFDAGRGDDVRPAGSSSSSTSGSKSHSISKQASPYRGKASLASRCDRYLPRFAQLYARCPRLCEELQQICFTVYVHVFIKFFEAGFREQARAFLFRYSGHFRKPTQHPMLVSLNRVLATGELCKTLNNFKYGKLRTFVTEETLTLLKEWLVGEDKLAVLQIINTHIDFRILTYAQYVRYKSGKEYLRNEEGVSRDPSASTSTSTTSDFTSHPLSRFLQPPKAQIEQRRFWEEVLSQPPLNLQKDFEEEDEDEEEEKPQLPPPPPTTFSREYLDVLSSIQSLREEPLLEPTLHDVDVLQLALSETTLTTARLSPRLGVLAAAREQDASVLLWDFSLADHLSYYSGRVVKHWSRVPVRKVASEVDFRWLSYGGIAAQGTYKGGRPREEEEEEDFEEEFDSEEEEEEEEEEVRRSSKSLSSHLSPTVLRGHSAPVYDLAYYTPSSLLLSGSGDGTVRAWDLHSGACLASYVGQASGPVWTVATSAEAVVQAQDLGSSQQTTPPNQYHSFVSAGGPEGSVYLWDISRTVPLRLFGGGHRSDVNTAAFHPNGSYFATGSDDRTVALWDANGPAGSSSGGAGAVRLFTGHQGAVLSLAFSRCGRFLASGAVDGTVRLWDIAEGGACGRPPVQTFAGGVVDGRPAGEVKGSPSSAFGSLSWSPGDRMLAGTGVYSEAVYLWENPVAYRLTADKPACLRVSSSKPNLHTPNMFSLEPSSSSFYRRQTMLRVQFISDRLVLALSKPKLAGPVACNGPEVNRLQERRREESRRMEKRRQIGKRTSTSTPSGEALEEEETEEESSSSAEPSSFSSSAEEQPVSLKPLKPLKPLKL